MRRRALYRSPIKLRLKKKTVQTVGGLILIGFAGLSLLALFGADTGFAKTLRDYEFEYVGWAAVFLPIASALLGAFLLRVGLPFTNANSAVGFTLFLTAIVSFTATFLPGQSGLVGNQIANFLSSFLTTTGAAFILFITATIALVVTLNTSLSTAFDAIGKSASFSFNTAKTLAGKNKEKEEEKKELPFATRGMKVNEAKKEEEPAISTAVVSNLPGDSQIWESPPLDLLTDSIGSKAERGDLKQNASIIEKTLESFGIQARVVEVNMGPAITQ